MRKKGYLVSSVQTFSLPVLGSSVATANWYHVTFEFAAAPVRDEAEGQRRRLTATLAPSAQHRGAWPNRPTRNRRPPPTPSTAADDRLRAIHIDSRFPPLGTSAPSTPPRRPDRPSRAPAGIPRRRRDGRRSRSLRAPAPRRCVDRPIAPAWAMSGVTMRTSAGPTSTPRPGSARLRRSRSSWSCSSSSMSPSMATTSSPRILLPLLGAILALLGLEASAVWRGVR